MSTNRGGKKNGDRKSDRCGNGGPGTPPGHLVRRLNAFEKLSGSRNFVEGAFHKPGSNKK